MIRVVIAVLIVFIPATAHAQAARADLLATSPAASNAVELRVGAEDAFVAEVAYVRTLTVAGHTFVVDGGLDVPWAELDVHDWRTRLGVALPIAMHGRWLVIPRVAPTLRGTRNEAAEIVGLGIDVATVAGYFAPHWCAGIEVGFDADLAAHIAPSTAYRMQVNDRASTGWYATPGGELRYGVTVGTTVRRNDVGLRAGMLRSTDGDSPTLPFLAMLSFARRW
jgi:hypothetical protein